MDRQFDKRVAVKLVNIGFAAELTGARAETERQILARLEHPHVARLLDAGLSTYGQPYIVMEWVDGVPIDQWIEQERPPRDRRLDLWMDAADAIGYAHRNLVVHRDLKPSNVLVGHDGVVKVVDFGIARLIGDGALLTTTTRHFTPRYASPEQVAGAPVSTATDIYGLGLLLCESLTGIHPFAEAFKRSAATHPALTSEPYIPRDLPADLAAIIRMALRPDPARRYSTVAAMVDDVSRYRRGLPVAAQPETVGYRLRRFAGRHRLAVAGTSLVVAVLLASVAVSVRQAREAAGQARVAASERDRANQEAARAARISTFLQTMLGAADPARAGRDVRVIDVLDQAAARVGTELRADPGVEAEVRATLARTYQSLGLLDPALVQARRALELREQSAGGYGSVARGLLDVAIITSDRGEYQETERAIRRALALYESHGEGSSAEAAGARRQLGEVLNETGRYAEAERLYRQALADYRRLGLRDTERAALAMNDLGVLLGSRGRFAEAEPLHREALRIMTAVHGPKHVAVAETLHNVAGVVDNQGRYAEAEPIYREVLALERELLGERHPKVILTRTSLANLYWMEKSYPDAERLAREALDAANHALPDPHPLTAYAEVVLGQALTDAGKPRDGEQHLRRALRMRRTLLGGKHWLVANTMSVLGGCLVAQQRFSEAMPLLDESYQTLLQDRGPAHEKTKDAARRVEQLRMALKR